MLLTGEPIETDEDVARVVKDYEHRWIIEEYHQAWKTGCAIEARALQSDENLDRIYAITSPIAVRLLQLKHMQNDQPDQSCQSMLSEDEWQCLYASVERGKKRPKQAPNIEWAVRGIGRLGGWSDSKHTGRIGWSSMWKGWARLEERVVGWKLARDEM
jgi:hypothetical protein